MEILRNLDIYYPYLIACIIVISLIISGRWLARRVGWNVILNKGNPKQVRLSITENLMLDSNRRLLLINLDNIEHLICIGGANDFTVKSDILPSVILNEKKIIEFENHLAEAKKG